VKKVLVVGELNVDLILQGYGAFAARRRVRRRERPGRGAGRGAAPGRGAPAARNRPRMARL